MEVDNKKIDYYNSSIHTAVGSLAPYYLFITIVCRIHNNERTNNATYKKSVRPYVKFVFPFVLPSKRTGLRWSFCYSSRLIYTTQCRNRKIRLDMEYSVFVFIFYFGSIYQFRFVSRFLFTSIWFGSMLTRWMIIGNRNKWTQTRSVDKHCHVCQTRKIKRNGRQPREDGDRFPIRSDTDFPMDKNISISRLYFWNCSEVLTTRWIFLFIALFIVILVPVFYCFVFISTSRMHWMNEWTRRERNLSNVMNDGNSVDALRFTFLLWCRIIANSMIHGHNERRAACTVAVVRLTNACRIAEWWTGVWCVVVIGARNISIHANGATSGGTHGWMLCIVRIWLSLACLENVYTIHTTTRARHWEKASERTRGEREQRATVCVRERESASNAWMEENEFDGGGERNFGK